MAKVNVIKLNMGSKCRFPGAEYNEDKVEKGVAELIFMGNVEGGFQRRINMLHQAGINCKQEVERYLRDHSVACNTATERWQFHLAVSVKEREMDAEQLTNFARQFMEKFGYGQQPYFIYYHRDTDNNHIHILSSRINKKGYAISDHQDEPRMNRTTNQLLNEDISQDIRKMLSYSFLTEGQFSNIIKACGYTVTRTEDATPELVIYRNGAEAYRISIDDVLKHAKQKSDLVDKERRAKSEKQLKATFIKFRTNSLNEKETQPKKTKAKTKKDLQTDAVKKHVNVNKLKKANGTPLTTEQQYQMNWFLAELHKKLGIEICFQKDKNGVVRGYSIVDHKHKIAMDGSKVMRLNELIDFSSFMQKQSEQKAKKTKTRTSDQALDIYRKLFTAKVFMDGKVPIILMNLNGTEYTRAISENQYSWYQHAKTDEERNDTTIRLAVFAFHREIFEAYRKKLSAECVRHGKLPEGTEINKVLIRKKLNNNLEIAVYFKGCRDIDALKCELTDADRLLWLKATNNAENNDAALRLQLATKYVIMNDMHTLSRKTAYSGTGLKPTSTLARKDEVEQFIPRHAQVMRTITSVFTQYGGSSYANREFEVARKGNYEDIDDALHRRYC